MRVEEYKEKYPENNWIFNNLIKHTTDRGTFYTVNMNCYDCGRPNEVKLSNLVKDTHGDGRYRCRHCSILLSRKKNPSVYRARNIKANNRGKDFYINLGRSTAEKCKAESKGWFSPEASIKRYETAKNNGTFMRSVMELQIEEEYGGQHSAPEFKYELDCYWPELQLGVEVDDPSHIEVDSPGEYQKPKGYHKKKDEYFKSLGITVLHLTFHHGDWKVRVQQFLDGTYTGPLIDLEDPTYGDIIY